MEEKKVQKTIKEAAKRNDMATCKVRAPAAQATCVGCLLPAAVQAAQASGRPLAWARPGQVNARARPAA
jgi:hypothetical protein